MLKKKDLIVLFLKILPWKKGEKYQNKSSEGGFRACVKKVKGLRSANWQLQSSHGDVNDSVGHKVNNIVTTVYGTKWRLEI